MKRREEEEKEDRRGTKQKEDGETGKGKEEGKVHAFKITKDKTRNQVSFMKTRRMSSKQRKQMW